MKSIQLVPKLLLIFILIFLNACSVEKRIYNKGYHIKWFNHQETNKSTKTKNHFEAKKQTVPTENHSALIKKEEEKTAKIQPLISLVKPNIKNESKYTKEKESAEMSSLATMPIQKNNTPKKRLYINDPCDTIYFANSGSKYAVKVVHISPSFISYKRCNDTNGLIFSRKMNNIERIAFANGEEYTKNKANAGEQKVIGGDKEYSLGIVIILYLFLGIIGIHRFYIGDRTIGIFYLLTFGICGLGFVLDGILLLTGNLKPKYGIYKHKKNKLKNQEGDKAEENTDIPTE